MRFCLRAVYAGLLTCAVSLNAVAADKTSGFRYQKVSDTVRQMLDAEPTPGLVVSPSYDYALLVHSLRFPPLSDLAQPMLRLGGLRIDPATNGPHHPPHRMGLTLLKTSDGSQRKLAVPANALLGVPNWSPDGRQFAFTNTTASGVELWVGDAKTGVLRKLPGIAVNGIVQDPISWMPDNHTLLVYTVVKGRGAPPKAPRVPVGPVIQESSGKPAPVRTYEDLLQNAHDEDLFDYYARSQLMLVDTKSPKAVLVGKPTVFMTVQISPDGQHLLVEMLHRPYSYLLPADGFPAYVQVWDRSGKTEYRLADLPAAEHVPIEGVLTGPRDYRWNPNAPATLVWVEALDDGDPKKKVEFRDRVMTLAAPFRDAATQVARTQHRCQRIAFGEKDLVLLSEYDVARRWVRAHMMHLDDRATEPVLLWDLSVRDRYRNPGQPLMRTLANGHMIMVQMGNAIFLAGDGASDGGDRPFLDRFDLSSRKAERLFQTDEKSYEPVTALLAADASRFITRYETPTEPPNYYVRTVNSQDRRALTHIADPAPQFQSVRKELVRYKRDDGVQLSFTLYLPPDCSVASKGMACRTGNEALPTLMWAYPLEYNDASTAGQVSGSQYRYTATSSYFQMAMAANGYAVLDNATLPVIGDPQTMNDTYIEQIVAGARAAIKKAAAMGVTDPNRVGVGGHSYGAFMTANLLAHSDLFKAGVARSGAYNRTLTPFGFQSERRTLWEAQKTYADLSPFLFADKIKTPILLIHGINDDNSGTFPIQSERMYAAIKGNGGTVRYVQLPYEAHSYMGRESIEHMLWETLQWFDKYVKNASAQGMATGK